MFFSLSKFIERLKFIVLFILLTMVCSYVYQHALEWIEPDREYFKPEGNAVKVFDTWGEPGKRDHVTERLKLFYWYGE